jgi:hypothetical protein
LDAVLELRSVWKYPAILTDELVNNDFGFADDTNYAESYFERRINCQRYLQHFQRIKSMIDDIERRRKRKTLQLF